MEDDEAVMVGTVSSGPAAAKVLRAASLTLKVFGTVARQVVAQFLGNGCTGTKLRASR